MKVDWNKFNYICKHCGSNVGDIFKNEYDTRKTTIFIDVCPLCPICNDEELCYNCAEESIKEVKNVD